MRDSQAYRQCTMVMYAVDKGRTGAVVLRSMRMVLLWHSLRSVQSRRRRFALPAPAAMLRTWDERTVPEDGKPAAWRGNCPRR